MGHQDYLLRLVNITRYVAIGAFTVWVVVLVASTIRDLFGGRKFTW